MTHTEYVRYALKTDMVRKVRWYFSTFAYIEDGNEYVSIEDGRYVVDVRGEKVKISNIDIKRPLLSFKDTITVTQDDVANVSGSITTTLGRVILNKLILADNFQNKIPFIDGKTNVGSIEKMIASRMFNNDSISVEEYIKFTKACGFLEALSRIVTVSATYKNILPPDGIETYKNNLIKEFNSKYGEDWVYDRIKIVEFEKLLKQYDDEWLKDDPTNGILTAGKIKNNARLKMYLTLGAELAFDKSTDKPNMVTGSLSDGYPKDEESLTQLFNRSRHGSYSRGKETQQGGAVAKELLRSISGITVVDGDCGSKLGKRIRVTEDLLKSLNGRYIIENNTIRPVQDYRPYLNQVVTIRSPMFCKSNITTSICSVCVGQVLSNYKDAISLMANNISDAMLTSSLKAMHNTAVKTCNMNIKEIIF